MKNFFERFTGKKNTEETPRSQSSYDILKAQIQEKLASGALKEGDFPVELVQTLDASAPQIEEQIDRAIAEGRTSFSLWDIQEMKPILNLAEKNPHANLQAWLPVAFWMTRFAHKVGTDMFTCSGEGLVEWGN